MASKYLFFYVFLVFILNEGVTAQTTIQEEGKYRYWQTLAGIEFSKSRDEYGEIYVPKFNEKIKSLEGKEIILPGYIVPFDGMFEPTKLILSSLPVASCFFCGGGGPETVAEVYLKKPVNYTTKLVSISGTLKLNNTDQDKLMYIITDATLTVEQ